MARGTVTFGWEKGESGKRPSDSPPGRVRPAVPNDPVQTKKGCRRKRLPGSLRGRRRPELLNPGGQTEKRRQLKLAQRQKGENRHSGWCRDAGGGNCLFPGGGRMFPLIPHTKEKRASSVGGKKETANAVRNVDLLLNRTLD